MEAKDGADAPTAGRAAPVTGPRWPGDDGSRDKPRFPEVGCSSCGEAFGPGDSGFSHCEDHAGLEPGP